MTNKVDLDELREYSKLEPSVEVRETRSIRGPHQGHYLDNNSNGEACVFEPFRYVQNVQRLLEHAGDEISQLRAERHQLRHALWRLGKDIEHKLGPVTDADTMPPLLPIPKR